MKWVSASEAIGAIAPGASIVLGGGCGEPTTLTAALVADAERLRGSTISSALHFGGFPFLGDETKGAFRYRTWLAAPGLARDPNVSFLLRTWRQSAALVARERPDVALVQVAPADARGRFSSGASAGFSWQAAHTARLVIAEVNAAAPRTPGPCYLQADEIDLAVEAGAPLRAYREAPVDAATDRIAEHLAELLPRDCALQLGIGSAPEALLRVLAHRPPRHLSLVSAALDGAVGLLEQGDLVQQVVVGELLGTPRLFSCADANPRFELRPSSYTHSARILRRFPNLVAVNSALEIDLLGNANCEIVNGARVSNVGGALDFCRVAAQSPEARAILALRATTNSGRSRLVARLSEGASVSIPGALVDMVVTEFGVAELSGKTPAERARAVIAIADPSAREALEREYTA
ncbi:MAG: acetyl-CoA hydrolase/transferase family protein [Chloroflexi bacterium]|nr:acetyl-CoA hydrolase/transferase family protein [Chloroflexota bacterium]